MATAGVPHLPGGRAASDSLAHGDDRRRPLLRPLTAARRYLERLASHDLAFRALQRIRTRFYRLIEPLAPGQLEGYRRGELLTRMVGDVDALQGLYLRAVGPPLVALLAAAAVSEPRRRSCPWQQPCSRSLIAGGVAVPALAGGLGRGVGRRQADARGELTAELVELLRGARSSSSSAASRTCSTASGRPTACSAASLAGMRSWRGSGTLSILVAGVTAAGVLAVAVSAHDAGTLDRVFVAMLALLALSAFDAVVRCPRPRASSRPLRAGRRVLEAADREPSVRDPAEPLPAPARPTLVALEAVTARYEPTEPPVLRDFDLRLEPGSRVALLGRSGREDDGYEPPAALPRSRGRSRDHRRARRP